jgi:hypothetical protein
MGKTTGGLTNPDGSTPAAPACVAPRGHHRDHDGDRDDDDDD